MNEEIRALIDSLRRGQYEDPTQKIELLSAALVEHAADVPLLTSLLKAPQIPLRIAAIDACRQRAEPELLEELIKLAQDPDAPWFEGQGHAAYRVDRVSWIRNLFDLSCKEYDRLDLDRADPVGRPLLSNPGPSECFSPRRGGWT